MENFNSTTSHVYSETNQEHLENHKEKFKLSSNEWAGFNQWKSVGRQVKKGSKGCKIMMVVDKKEEKANGEEFKRQVVKSAYVFNYEHTEEI